MLLREAALVRAEIARSTAALRQYGWTEQTEVLVGGSVKSLDTLHVPLRRRRQTPENAARQRANEIDAGRSTSNRPTVRSKADLRDYIERSVSRIHDYAPPKPELIDHVLHNGQVSFGQSADGKSEIRFSRYYVDGDSYVFTYDPQSKLLLRANVCVQSRKLEGPGHHGSGFRNPSGWSEPRQFGGPDRQEEECAGENAQSGLP